MKKFLALLALTLFVWVGSALGAGTVTQTDVQIYPNTRALTFTCTADSAAHTYPATGSDGNIDGYVFLVVTNPGTVGPTDNYDITLTDADTVDVMGGELLNRDILNSEQAVPLIDGVFGSRFVKGPLIITITNNLVDSAVTVVTVFYYR